MPVTLRRFTIDELDRFPDDGNRYELLDGVLFVTPAPLPPHEAILHRLILLLGKHIESWPEIRMAVRSEVVLLPTTSSSRTSRFIEQGEYPAPGPRFPIDGWL